MKDFKDKCRSGTWAFLTIPLLMSVLMVSTNKLFVFFWILAKITAATSLGYWIDRLIFPYARPHVFENQHDRNVAMLRRAAIISSTIIAASLSL